jgi:hypothetical protein
VTDEDTGNTAKPTKGKTVSTGTRSTSSPRAKSATEKTAAAKSASESKAAASKAAAPKATASGPATAAPAAAAAPAPAVTPDPTPVSTGGGSGSGGQGGSGGSGSGGGYTRVPAPTPSEPAGSGLFSLPIILSVAAIVLAILIPVLKDRASGPAVPPADIQALKVQQTELVAAVASLTASIEALGVEQDAMNASIEAVKVPSIMIAGTDLSNAIAAGEPFQEQLNLFKAIVGDNESLASVYSLQPLAPTGVPTTRELQAGFGDVSHAVIAAYQTVESEGDLAKRVSETMANLTAATTRLRWRLDGTTPPEGTSPLAIMARAEKAAEAADFDAVILELETLPDDLKAMTTAWIEQVETARKAQIAKEDLELFMIETIASTRK